MAQLDVEALNSATFAVAQTLKLERRPVDVDDFHELAGKLSIVARDFADYLAAPIVRVQNPA